jgi:hypothetical protein
MVLFRSAVFHGVDGVEHEEVGTRPTRDGPQAVRSKLGYPLHQRASYHATRHPLSKHCNLKGRCIGTASEPR